MALLEDPHPLLTLGIVIVAGVLSGAVARLVRLPGVTGQIVAGVAMGASGLHLFSHQAIEELQPVTHFALGLMAVTIGAHLSVKKLRGAGRRLAWLLLLESTVTPALVFAGVVGVPGIDWSAGLLLGTLAVSTAPVTVVALVKEARAKGVFVKTLVAAVALNNVTCILLFELARAAAETHLDPAAGQTLADTLLAPGRQLLVAFVIGGGAAVLLNAVGRLPTRPELLTAAGAATILVTAGASEYAGVSPLLSCMVLGAIQTNTIARDKLADTVFASFEPAILAVFFTLAGMHLSFDQAAKAGLAAVLFFGLRGLGKVVACGLAMRIAGATARVRRYLGIALLPQAGIAIGLVILLQDDPVFQRHPAVLDLFVAIVLTVVTLNEIVGPIATRWALRKAGEVDKDRVRLIDFLQEENIVVDFHAPTKEGAIERLVEVMIRSHHLDVDRATLLRGALDREAQASTCFGGGLAVPHTILPDGHPMVGVMGISSEGLDFETPDGRPVHCMVLLGTGADERERHLQVLATLARTIGTDLDFQDRLYHADSPAHAADLLHGEESEGFNVYLDADWGAPPGRAG